MSSTTASRFRPLLESLINPNQYDFWARQLGSIEAWQRCFARVTAVEALPDGSNRLSLTPNRHGDRVLTGGACDVVVELDGRNCALTLQWQPAGKQITVLLPREPADRVSRILANDVGRGHIVELLPASRSLAPAKGNDQAVDESTAQVYLRRSDRTVTVARDRSLLEALEEAGVTPTYGCRRGICNRCSCTRYAGQTTDLKSGESSDEPGLPIRICVQRADSRLELDL